MKTIIITAFFVSFSLGLSSQTIRGVVLNEENKQVITNVHVYINEKIGAISNEKGKFELRLSDEDSNSQFVHISHVAFNTKKINLQRIVNKKDVVIYLKPLINTLDETLIGHKRKLKSRLKYEELRPMNKPLYAFASVLIDDEIYVVGGNNSFDLDRVRLANRNTSEKYRKPTLLNFLQELREVSFSQENYSDLMMIYDINKNIWKVSDKEFRARTSHSIHAYKDDMYILGGDRKSKYGEIKYLDHVIEVYNRDSNTISHDFTNPHQAVNFASIQYGNYIITVGGIEKINKNGSKRYSDAMHLYNLETGRWYELGKLPNPREVKGLLLNNKIYLVGGRNRLLLNTIESFDLDTGKWEVEGKLFNRIARPGLASHKNTIYIFNNSKLLTYNTETDVLNEYSVNLQIQSPELFFHKGKLYIIGGYIEKSYSTIASQGVYSIDLNQLSKTKIRRSKNLKWEEK
ncbi:carboxypeptidase-like regulatory domain-containing protein [Winogradskyella sp. 3972H.M.0a.05]|uniref:Kelch repeat-containing protein n=1 Tax=Winogradskyella sp. 3972H.M.0a.05 TaxID=2950277 RepID=UPI00339A6119